MRRAITRRGFTPGVAFLFGGQSWHNFSAMQRAQKTTLIEEMRLSGPSPAADLLRRVPVRALC